ncbi:hypothetical protein BDD12DRAFT_903110 [Trichophaea hybrida]|nr:hypothetical protein BDD12DRAFT_903110 [Trichophaea hybrida]
MSIQDADVDMGKIYMDITAAEQQATFLENQLRALESKLDVLIDEHDNTLDTSARAVPQGGDYNDTTTKDSAKEEGA